MECITIIIPVYNCERTIERCIASVQKQTLKELEILCIDDGSIDHSSDIILEMMKSDSRIRLFSKENGGAGSARNKGLEYAMGTYVCFLDADDLYLDESALEIMLERCKTAHVKICGSFMSVYQNGRVEHSATYKELLNLTQNIRLKYVDFQWDYDFTTFLMALDIIKDNNIYFPESSFYEDPPFLSQVMYYAGEFTIANVNLYCYDFGSIIREVNEKQCRGLLVGIEQNLKFSHERGLTKLFEKTLERVDYEYADWLIKACLVNPEVLEEVHKLQKYINSINGYEEYQLRTITQMVIIGQIDYESYLTRKISENSKFFIYGNGKTAHYFRTYVEKQLWRDKLCGTVVTRKNDSDTNVYNIEEVSSKEKDSLFLIAVVGSNIKGIVDELNKRGMMNYEILNQVFLTTLM